MSTYQHLRIKKVNIERPRHKQRRVNFSKNKTDNILHGDALKQQVTLLKQEFGQAFNRNPPEFNPAFIFRLKLEESVHEDEWRRSGLTVLNEEANNIVVLLSPDELAEFQRRIDEYSQPVPAKQNNPSYAWLATVTDEMRLWQRDDRIGQKLTEKLDDLRPTEEYLVDVELWHYGTRRDCLDRQDELRHFVSHKNGKFLDSYIGSSLSLARIKISGDALTELLNVGIVRSVDFPPKPQLSVSRLLGTALDDFPSVSPPPDDAPGICIIDSGIDRGHPMLGAAIGDTRSIPSQMGDSLDKHGHGTMVAGIALYGDVKACIDKRAFAPQFYLYGARVTNAENSFDDEKLIVTQMREAIETFQQEYGCRVFNISLGDPKLIYKGGKPSAWAYMLDTLARDLHIVIVVSAGNLPLLPAYNEEAEKIVLSYPHYLLEQEARIIEPATAANVLTVGSLTHSEFSYFMERYPNDPSIKCVAKLDQPSPFTRSGLGVNNAIKPDVCEYGGNVVWRGNEHLLSQDPDVGIVSMNLKHLSKLFATDIGTSFAAPKIAHLAAQILNRYPDVSANLVRALIANAAHVPSATDELFHNDKMKILKLCGYGRPEPQRALFSSENRVTLIAEDTMVLDHLHLYEIPIPDHFKKRDGERQISVSLAFAPPVRHTRKDYLGVKMSFRLFRGLKTDRIIEWYAKRTDANSVEKFADKHECDMQPSFTERKNSTLQKALFIAKRNRAFTDYEGDVFHLLLTCKSGWASPEEFYNQSYALAVTIEHKEQIDLYNLVKLQIQLPQRIKV